MGLIIPKQIMYLRTSKIKTDINIISNNTININFMGNPTISLSAP